MLMHMQSSISYQHTHLYQCNSDKWWKNEKKERVRVWEREHPLSAKLIISSFEFSYRMIFLCSSDLLHSHTLLCQNSSFFFLIISTFCINSRVPENDFRRNPKNEKQFPSSMNFFAFKSIWFKAINWIFFIHLFSLSLSSNNFPLIHSFYVGLSKKKTIGNSLYFPRKRQWFSFFLYVIFPSLSFYNFIVFPSCNSFPLLPFLIMMNNDPTPLTSLK